MRPLPIIATLLCASHAAAEHDHGPHAGGHDHDDAIAASVHVLAATYESMLFVGDYQGLGASARWHHGRFGASASLATYRLTKNGRAVRGLGDAIVDGQVTLAQRGAVTAGIAFGASLPTGNDREGIGMGHVMLMPVAWSTWGADEFELAATVGYHHSLGDESLHAEHGGAWPLVDPMSYREVTFGASGSIALARVLRTGVRLSGAVPVGDGNTRFVGGVRTVWTEGRVETAFEIQTGLAGDPFEVRGLLETSVRLR